MIFNLFLFSLLVFRDLLEVNKCFMFVVDLRSQYRTKTAITTYSEECQRDSNKLAVKQWTVKVHNSCSKIIFHSFIHSVFRLTTVPKPPPKLFLHIVRCRTSSFKCEYPLLSLRSSSSFLRLLARLLVTSISPFIFPSITCFRRQFLRKMWPIQLAFRFLISCRIFLCSLI